MKTNKRTKAKITYLWDDFPFYVVRKPEDCRDSTDKSAYLEAVESQETVLMGKICVELID